MAGEISASRLSEARNAVSIARALHTKKTTKKGLVLILFIYLFRIVRAVRWTKNAPCLGTTLRWHVAPLRG